MAGKLILPNAENCTLAELDTAIRCASQRRQSFRLMAIRCLILGQSYALVLQTFNVDGQTLRRWIKRFNAEGIDGVLDKRRSGRPRKIAPGLHPLLLSVIKDPALAEQAHWTARKFHGNLREELGLEVGYRSVVSRLHEQGFRLKVPRPWPSGQEEEARVRYLARLAGILEDEEVGIWYLDEMGVEGDPRPRRRWAERGSKPTLPYGGTHLRMSVAGVICPRTGKFYALEFSRSNSIALQVFLDYANADLDLRRRRNIIVCDNASWHRNKSINWGKFEVLFLPPYSPDLNPIERLWLLIKAEWFSDFYAKDMNELIGRLDCALNWAMERAEGNRKTCAIG